MKIGVHLPNDGRMGDGDWSLLRGAQLTLYKWLLRLDLDDDPLDWSKLPRGPRIEYIVRLYADMRGGPIPWREFGDRAKQRLRRLVDQFGDAAILVEIHNEPNHPSEGFGPTHEGAHSFKAWYANVYQVLNEWCDMQALKLRLGWPGLAVGEWNHRERTWSEICSDQIRRSDWVGCHCYWQSGIGGSLEQLSDKGLGQNYSRYLGMMRGQVSKQCPECGTWITRVVHQGPPVYVTEVGNSNCHNPGLPKLGALDQKLQYLSWLDLAERSGVAGATFFMYGGTEDWAGFRLFPETIQGLGEYIMRMEANRG